MLIYLLRHGQTQYNLERRYQGTLDIPLSIQGRQSLCTADFNPALVYCSPLSRALESAQILFPQAQLVTVAAFKEMCHGTFEGKNYKEMEHDQQYRSWVDSGCLGQCPGGESKSSFCKRTCTAFCTLVEQALQAQQPNLVIVAHGGTQMAIMEQFGLPKKYYFYWCSPNGGGYLLQTEQEQWQRDKTMQLIKTVQYTKEALPCG